VALNLQSVVRIAAEVTGLQSITKLEKGIEGADKAARSAKDGFKAVVSSELFQAAAVTAAALAAAIGLSTKAAIEFDSAMADVRKVISGLDTPAGLKEIRNEIFELSKQMPITAKGFADIYAAAGQAGIPKAEINDFARSVGQIAVAFDMTAEEAGTAMAKLRTSLGLSQPELIGLADAMNHLSNNTASTAKQVTEFVLRSGTAGKAAGLSAEQTAAFGAAMIATGAESEVAATSFNNMVKALSRGSSMTDRQTYALSRLGLITQDATEYEQQLTQAVQEESRERLAIAENETAQLKKEVDRRYRDQLQVVQDGFEDQSEAFQDSIRDQQDAQIKGLQRRMDAEIDAAKERAEATDRSSEVETQRIRDFYDQQIDAVRDNTDQQLKERSRLDRDRLQQIRDNMDDQKEVELNGLNDRFEAAKRAEEQRSKEAIAAAKAAAEQLSMEAGQTLAKNLQRDAIGTITDVFERIRALPAEQRLSVVSDLFGDEARALLPLINNTELLASTLALVGDKSKYAGSSQEEYFNRLTAASSQLQLAQNNLNVLSITLGEQFVPALIKTVEALNPVIEGLAWMIDNIPGFGPTLAILTGGFVALVAVLPGLASLVFVVKELGGFALIFTKIGGALAGLGKILLGVFTGPVGWAALLVAAGVAIYAFRDQIGDVFNAIGGIISEALSNVGTIVSNVFSGLGQLIYTVFAQPFIDLWNNVLREPVTAMFNWIGGYIQTSFQNAYALAYAAFVLPFIALWQNVLREPVTAMITWLQGTLSNIATFFNNNVVTPIRGLWDTLVQYISSAIDLVATKINNVWQTVVAFFTNNVATPIRDAWTALTEFLPKAMENLGKHVQNIWTGVVNTIKNAIRNVLQFIANALNGIGSQINRLVATFNRLPGPDIAFLPTLSVPQFAEGGVVSGPTLAMVGEGGEPEYIVPQSKASGFAANWMAGQRGAAAIPAFANGGMVMPRGAVPQFAEGGMVVPGNAQVSIQTGPVTQMNGQNYVTTQDLSRAVQAGVQQTLNMMRNDRSTRRAVGLA
jgi:TP901 family phage tail tape measure protein